MYREMLVPLDGSKAAESVLPYVSRMVAQLGLNVTLLHICDGPSPSQVMCQAYVDRVAEPLARDIGGRGGISAKAVTGSVPNSILSYAADNHSDLILMAAYGQSGRAPWQIGSVAHKVLTTSPVPVLIVRRELPARAKDTPWPKTVIAPLDGSPLSEKVLPLLETLAGQSATPLELKLLRVCEPPVVLADYPEADMPEGWDEHVKRAHEGARMACGVYLGKVEGRLQATGLVARIEVVLGDRAAEAIIEFVAQDPLALVVMTTHGRSGVARWPFGHVADRILLATENPLLLLRPKA
jgi:nucleotide-binding universal stress UspA family protein